MKKTTIFLFIFAISFLVMPYSSAAQDVRFSRASGFVNDYAQVLSQETKLQIEGFLNKFQEKTQAEIAVVTVETTAPLTIEEYAVGLFQKWGIGKKGSDNGVLVLVAASDRKVRIEVGYGLEGVITDLKSKIIIEDLVVPAFRKGDYNSGIAAAVVSLAKIVGDEYGVELDLDAKMYNTVASAPGRRRKSSPLGNLFTFLFFILIFGFRFGTLFFLMGSGGGGYWSGGSRGSFGGGFGGFGGGLSGGGGASGSW